jgi:hypothetical protein
LSWGNNGAGPTGVQPFAPGQIGQPPGQGGATLPPLYNASFESVLAAVSRGELPLNIAVAPNVLGGPAGSPNVNISLAQAMTQGAQQNGTNGLGVRSGPSPAGEGTAAINIGSTNPVAGAVTDSGSTLVVDPRQVTNVPGYSNPIQYTGA